MFWMDGLCFQLKTVYECMQTHVASYDFLGVLVDDIFVLFRLWRSL